MEKPFVFKKFKIHQDRSAMKIGTDAVLLGAWASLENNPKNILDIGAGTGVISLMLAQRSSAENIEAIEIEENAFEQCVENFETSSWANRLFCYHSGLDEFIEEIDDRYDLIVSNPPFFTEVVSSGDNSRDTARQNQSLPFEELLESASALLAPEGLFAVIIPFKEEEKFLGLASSYSLFPIRMTRVRGNPTTEIKRSLLELSFIKTEVIITDLTIELERHKYTDEYVGLTKDFYLKM